MNNPKPNKAADLRVRGTSDELVVLLHAYNSGPDKLEYIEKIIGEEFPNADIYVPRLPVSRFSWADPNHIVSNLLEELDRIWDMRMQGPGGQSYRNIIFIGHSIGGLLARKLYICACGENADAPFEDIFREKGRRKWGHAVTRIILLAAMNRGWSISHHLGLKQLFVWRTGEILGNFITTVLRIVFGVFGTGFRKRLVIFALRRGAPFITQLRIQWLSMKRHSERKGTGNALTVQMLGTIDDMVAPEDNIDLVTGKDFIYLDVPYSGHPNVIEMDGTREGKERRTVFLKALKDPADRLAEVHMLPGDMAPNPPDPEVSDVVFVIHGIRDEGHWTEKIARRVKFMGHQAGKVFKTETSTYGYFAMLPFLLSSRRRDKVEWLMDQYTEDLALYPNADFSFFGHSNGTYLLAKAMQEYPACHFKHVVFAGSVIRRDYPWKALIESGRVQSVLNYVASSDWVVAWFPKVFEILRWQDLGGAGHDGFTPEKMNGLYQVKYAKGSHGAALKEDNWNAIAHFIINGTQLQPEPESLLTKRRSRPFIISGILSPFIWILIIGLVVLGAWGIFKVDSEWVQTLLLVIYALLIYKVITKF